MAPSDLAAEDGLRAVVAVVEATWNEGCPVAGSDPTIRAVIARRAIRRWASACRRGVHPDLRDRDLAIGLIAAFEEEPKLVGPLARDYEFLASRIAAVLRA